jgi:hypothetical protein
VEKKRNKYSHFFLPSAQVIFIDSAVVPNANQKLVEDRLLHAVRSIRSINLLSHVPILIAAEAKFGPTGGTVMYMFDILKKHYGEDLGEIHIMCESGPNRNPGVPKDPKRTQAMVNLARRQMRFDRVYFSRHLRVGLSNGQTVEGNISKLLDQMRKFILKKLTKEGSTADPKWKWEGEEGHDDMMVTFLMCMRLSFLVLVSLLILKTQASTGRINFGSATILPTSRGATGSVFVEKKHKVCVLI